MTPTAYVPVRLPAPMRDRLVEVARANERTLAGEARLAIREHLERLGAPGDDRPKEDS